MTIIVRLQGLPPVADSFDVRQFFYGLNIPKGGVYITGGKYGEAFIIFASFEDAEYAMTLSGRPLKTSFIYLSYSNEAELRRALEVYRIGPADTLGGLSTGSQRPIRPFGSEKPSFLYIHGMSQKITKVELRDFFKGFTVEDVIFLKFVSGVRNGNALIKFRLPNEANDALKLDGVFLGGSPVTLRLSDEEEWNKNGGDSAVQKRESSPRRRSSRRSPPRRSPRRLRRSPRRSPPPRRRPRTRSRSPRRERRRSPYTREFYVHLINVSYRAEKPDIKKFFFDLEMDDSHITFLMDKEGRRTREAFAMFTTQKDYKRALNLNLESFKGHTINILPISKRGMTELIERRKKSRSSKERSSRRSTTLDHKKCVFLRNFAADVTKADIIAFFKDFTLKEDDITLLLDDKGVGLGEALVKFSDEKEAAKAEKLNHEKYKETEILISRVSVEQMKSLTKDTDKDSKPEESMVTEASDNPDTSGDSSTKEADKTDDSKKTDDKNEKDNENKEPDAVENGEKETKEAVDEEQGMDVNQSVNSEQNENASDNTDPLQHNDSADECQDDSILEMEDDVNGDVDSTTLFIRNLPNTITSEEIEDFLQDYSVSSVNLKYIAKGEATVRMSDAEAKAAIEALNKKEVGSKKVLLSLI